MTVRPEHPAPSARGRIQQSYWDQDHAERRSPDHPAVRALFEPRAEFIASLVPSPPDASVLDVGAGNGFLSVPLQQRVGRTVALDASETMLALNPCRECVHASATSLPFDDRSFDVVVESHLLHHLEAGDRARAVREMARVARRAVVLYEPNRNNALMFAFGAIMRHERMSLVFSRRYLRTLLARIPASRCEVRVEGWVVPNRAPAAWLPLGRALERSPLRAMGFYLRGLSRLTDRTDAST